MLAGRPQNRSCTALALPRTRLQVVTQENDGTYAENQFIKMDPVPGTAVKIGDNGDTVTIYVAGKPPHR